MHPLASLARPSGAFAMVAIDQRESLRTIFRNETGAEVDDATLVAFKIAVARVLSPHASALLVDRPFGLAPTRDAGVLDPSCALIVADDLSNLDEAKDAAREADVVVLMAGLVNGVPQPWTGLAFVLAIALAIVTGVSKTSSA